MKTLKLIIFVFISIALNGCEGKLDLTNPNKPTGETFWKTEADFRHLFQIAGERKGLLIHILTLQRLCGNALLHQCQPKQNMLCADIFIAQLCCGLLCPLQHIKGLFCIFLLHPIHLPWFNLLAINDCDC